MMTSPPAARIASIILWQEGSSKRSQVFSPGCSRTSRVGRIGKAGKRAWCEAHGFITGVATSVESIAKLDALQKSCYFRQNIIMKNYKIMRVLLIILLIWLGCLFPWMFIVYSLLYIFTLYE